MVRGWAIVFFLVGVATVHEVCRRWCGHWAYGVLGAVSYMAVIGHANMAVMFRPVNLLSALCLLIVYWVVRARQGGSVRLLLAATACVGFAISVKVHAVGLLPFIVLGMLLLRKRDWAGETGEALSLLWRQHHRVLILAAVAWLLIVAVMNAPRPLPELDPRPLMVVGLAGLFLYSAIRVHGRVHPATARSRAKRLTCLILHPMWPIALVAVGVGLVLPNTVFLDQLPAMLRYLFYAVTGRAVNTGFETMHLLPGLWRQWQDPALLMQLPLILLAVVGWGGQGRVGNRGAGLWLAAAAMMFALSAMRAAVHPSTHHYAPAMTLCIPLMLSALQQVRRWAASLQPVFAKSVNHVATSTGAAQPPHLLAWCAVALVAIGPLINAWHRSLWNRDRCDVLARVTDRLIPLLDSDEFIMTDYWAQNADAGYFMLVRSYCFFTPPRHYRSLPDTPTALRYAATLNIRPRFYLTSGEKRTYIEAVSDGRWIANSAWGGRWHVRPIETHTLPNITIGVYAIEEPCLDSFQLSAVGFQPSTSTVQQGP